MKKKDLDILIKSEIRKKQNLNEDFYLESEMYEDIETPTFDPYTTVSTDTEYDIESKKQKSKIAKAANCEDEKQHFYIKPKKDTRPGDVYMISDGGSKYCVQVVKMVNDEPEDFKIINSYSECTDCIIDLKLSEKSGGFSLGGGSATQARESGGYQEVTPNKKFTPNFDKQVKPQGLPQARKRNDDTEIDFDDMDYEWDSDEKRSLDESKNNLFENIRMEFKSKLNEINSIINRKNKNIR